MYTAGAPELRAFQVFFLGTLLLHHILVFVTFPLIKLNESPAVLLAGKSSRVPFVTDSCVPWGRRDFQLRGKIDPAVPSSTVCGSLSLFAADSIAEFPVGQ